MIDVKPFTQRLLSPSDQQRFYEYDPLGEKYRLDPFRLKYCQIRFYWHYERFLDLLVMTAKRLLNYAISPSATFFTADATEFD